ncbi:YugN-like family protein [Seinonella peptonophila]|uniref:YugN-like family protein n=1 Tax=Seinonella peptonophila TaxID=112248 RepID=A0A1M4VM32_9BACL|nr:YugN family protein [Seinonella peptonophila]SHE69915.1 YugN-like family protein [Seinonella peptonophila]
MIFTEAKTKGIEKSFAQLETTMKGLGFLRWSWDYEKVTYDLEYNTEKGNYYLRFPGRVIGDKQLEHPKAQVRLHDPVFIQHFFPHGVDDTVEVPSELNDQVIAKIAEVEAALKK